MIWNLIATLVAGLGAAGIALILRSLSRQKLPKWIVPVFAGLGMLGYQIYMEYTWFELKKEKLPEGFVVVSSESNSMIWRPWTFVFPMTDAFTVLDLHKVNHRMTKDGALVDFPLFRFERGYVDNAQMRGHVLSCETGEMVQVDDDLKMQPGTLVKVDTSSPLYQQVCR